MGITLRDHDALGYGCKGRKVSSYLVSDDVKGNHVMLGSAKVKNMKIDDKKHEDVVYIYVLPPLTIVEKNVKKRQQIKNKKKGECGVS